jgi:hypothetical protein
MKRLGIALHFWIRFGIQWRDQYMKFGFRRAWYMAGEMLKFREHLRKRGMTIERESSLPR